MAPWGLRAVFALALVTDLVAIPVLATAQEDDAVLCNQPLLGSSASPVLPDRSLSASSEEQASALEARLDLAGWLTTASDLHQWLQFDFEGVVRVTRISTKGHRLVDAWVTDFQIQYSGAANNWALLGEVFQGNEDRHTIRENIVQPPILATKLKLRPVAWHGGIAMSVEIHGCRIGGPADNLDCVGLRCGAGAAVSEGGKCCRDGVCGTLSTHASLVRNQLYCAQRRYDALAEAAAEATWRVPEEVLRHVTRIRHQKETFQRDGFLALRGALSSDLIYQVKQSFQETVWSKNRHERPGCHLEFSSMGSFRVNRTLSLRSSPYLVRKRPYRLVGIHLGPEEPKAGPWNMVLWHASILEAVARLLGGPAKLLQALIFERGSQQTLHDDTWYLPGSDHRGGMVGVWVALEPATAANGPLFYYPGSHLSRDEFMLNPAGRSRREQITLPDSIRTPKELQDAVLEQALKDIESGGLREELFLAEPGDVGIWHERLLHGGRPILEMSPTRLSLVMHYVLGS